MGSDLCADLSANDVHNFRTDGSPSGDLNTDFRLETWFRYQLVTRLTLFQHFVTSHNFLASRCFLLDIEDSAGSEELRIGLVWPAFLTIKSAG